jgi:hypothetical protein
MKCLVETKECEGLESLLGKVVQVWCMNYIYSGTLVGVNSSDIKLSRASVVYETGPLNGKHKDSQPLPNDLYIRTSAIESYGEYTSG